MKRTLILLIQLFVLAILLSGCEQRPQLERIQERGELLVATRNAPTTHFPGAHGPEGLEFELVTRFAQTLGVQPRFVFPDDLAELIDDTRNGRVHLAAAGLTATIERQRYLRFGTPYQEITEQLVYRRGDSRPRALSDVQQGQLQVLAGSSHEESLQTLQREHPELSWTSRRGITLTELLEEVDSGVVGLSISDTNELARAQLMLRYLKPAFDIGEPRQLAWAFPRIGDDSLYQVANDFIEKIRADGTLDRLLERYYGHTNRMNYVDRREFQRHLLERLPAFRDSFQAAAEDTGYDWRLLAAIGYQESHWRADAVSPTGVRGLMMLTKATAKQVNVSDRTDPHQSISGGARYLKIVENKIPQRIGNPDRIWFTLAGYNVGFGHLEDARILTQRQGGEPDLWMDVKQRLPLLRQKKYYQTLKNGRARGDEPVNYVQNIRNYYELLVWHENNPQSVQNN